MNRKISDLLSSAKFAAAAHLAWFRVVNIHGATWKSVLKIHGTSEKLENIKGGGVCDHLNAIYEKYT